MTTTMQADRSALMSVKNAQSVLFGIRRRYVHVDQGAVADELTDRHLPIRRELFELCPKVWTDANRDRLGAMRRRLRHKTSVARLSSVLTERSKSSAEGTYWRTAAPLREGSNQERQPE